MKNPVHGFTLIEMLVALSLLALVMVLFSHIVGSVSQITDLSKRKMDAISQLTFALDRLDTDFRRAAKRNDLRPYFAKKTGNDELRFYSQVGGYSGDRGVSLVAYSVVADAEGKTALQRSASGRSWDENPLVFDASANAGSVAIDSNDTQVLTPGVYRFEVGFIDKATGAYKLEPAQEDWSDVSGILVTVAALDETSRKVLGAGTQAAVAEAAGWLGDFDGVEPPAIKWQKALDAHAAQDELKAKVMGKSRIRQRYYGW